MAITRSEPRGAQRAVPAGPGDDVVPADLDLGRFLVPVTLLELTFGVLGDLFGRKRLLIGGSVLPAAGEFVSVLTPGAATPTGPGSGSCWTGQAQAGIGAAVLFPTSLAMVAAGTHSVKSRARGIAIWAAALSAGGFISPVLGGLVTKIPWGSDPYAAWRWAFVAVGILALISAGVACTAQNSSAPEGRSLDWPGQITIAVALFALLSAVPVDGLSLASVIAPLVLVGVGFAFALSGVTAVAVNTVPNHLAGLASGTTSQLGLQVHARARDHRRGRAEPGGQPDPGQDRREPGAPARAGHLRPGARARARRPAGLGRGRGERGEVRAARRERVPATVPGPKGTPVPVNPLKDIAFHALGQAYSLGYVICGVAALVAAALAATALRGLAHRSLVTEESLAE